MRGMKVLLLALLLVSVCLGQCPYNCSGHGSCSGGECECDAPYTGPGCSTLALGDLSCNGGPSQVGTLAAGEAASFSVDLEERAAFVTLVVEVDGGVTQFLRFNDAASTSTYDWRNDTSSPLVEVAGARPGLYYGLAYAASSASGVSVTVMCTTLCPNDCSSHGACDESSGECSCDDPYTGVDCSTYIERLDDDTDFTWKCDGGPQSVLFSFPSSFSSAAAVLTVQARGGDAVMVMAPSNPSAVHYSARLTTSSSTLNWKTAVIEGSIAASPPWSITMISCSNNYTTLRWNIAPACPNQCHVNSGQGTCDDALDTCACVAPYQGDDCGLFRDMLTPGSSHRASLESGGQVHQYVLSVETFAGFDVKLVDEGGSKDGVPLQLLLGSGAEPPSPSSYIVQSKTNGSDIPAVLRLGWWEPLNVSTTWWAVVVAPFNAPVPLPYSLSLRPSARCPGKCGTPGRGDCNDDGVCECRVPYVLADCSARLLTAAPDRLLQGGLRAGEWEFFAVSLHSGNAVLVELWELPRRGGDTWLVVRFDRLPSLQDFLEGDFSGAPYHSVKIRSENAAPNSTLYVGVYGSPLGSTQHPTRYSLKVSTGCQTYSKCDLCVSDPDCGWCLQAPFNQSTGTCVAGTLSGPYAGDYCGTYLFASCDVHPHQASVLNLGYIIGAVIGAIVLLAVSLAGYLVFRQIRSDEAARIDRLQNLEYD